ncbi:aminotransferase class I/II-fold pyridoxal phosphate-dependent enzyme [Streptomyces gamaensis]|uniref:Aminotransferase class I/II-fold pyridoxal phosphate-dependent enzyme n=1 Tax=Streptomyces gamaensis TaxID=1763542 RepID=A0ABW0YUZ4_9ACTN
MRASSAALPAVTAPERGLPVLPELAERLAAAARTSEPEPAGGGAALRAAACGYWARRALPTSPEDVLAASGAAPLLLALLASAGGDVLLTRPCAAWYAPLARLAGRPAYHVPVPAECGGVPDPVALLETVRRVRDEGGRPRVLVVSVADDPTGTVAPPELLHEAGEAAVAEGLTVVSDETWRDVRHAPRETVFPVPAEMWPEHVVVLTDLAGAFLPTAWPAAVARFPAAGRGAALRERVASALAGVRAELPPPVAVAASYALAEPEPVRARAAAAARVYGALAGAVRERLLAAGALCRPPQAGPYLYADLGELREALAARGITDSVELEDRLSAALGRPVPGGHRFGDAPDELRLRFSVPPLLGGDDARRQHVLYAPDPPAVPEVARELAGFTAALTELAGG